MTTSQRPAAALLLAGLLWGTSDVAGKSALEQVPPVSLAAFRFTIAAVGLLIMATRNGGVRLRGGRIALMGVLGFGTTFLLQNAGLQRTGAANASMLQGIAPILVIVGARLFLGETLGRNRVIGTVTALFGVVILTGTEASGFTNPGLGDLCVLGSAAGFASFILIGRPVFREHGALPVLAGASVWAVVLLAPLSMLELLSGETLSVGAGTVGLVLYLGVGCSALTYLLWGYALRRIEAGQAAVFDNVIPIVGLIAATTMLKERPTHWQIAGGLLVVVGAWTTTRSDEPRRLSSQSAKTAVVPEVIRLS